MTAALTEEGLAINSPWIEGLPTQQAKSKMLALLEEKKIGKRHINYKLRDWLFSRQRYWGEPFPLVHLADGTTVRLADSELPLTLPELQDFKPTGTIDPPLSKAKDWVGVWVVLEESGVARGAGGGGGTAGAVEARRELNTMPQWAGSCWYYLRISIREMRRHLSIPRLNDIGWAQQKHLSPQHSVLNTRPALSPPPAAWTCTSAASSTRFSTCSTRDSGIRFCLIAGWYRMMSRFGVW